MPVHGFRNLSDAVLIQELNDLVMLFRRPAAAEGPHQQGVP
jgi:hypothetical protein